MMQRFGRKLILLAIFVLAIFTFFTGINWGLPSRQTDPFLFGSHVIWSGREIMDLAGPWDRSAGRGADIAMHVISKRDQPVVLNDTDEKRAEIARRYRLYSCQPDEMITFRSLSGMNPAKLQLDPKMYQYGGLWIYPVGGLLKLASMFHWVKLRTDLAFYLDYPEEIGKFYLVARAYSALWGLLGVFVVYGLAREWSRNFLVSAIAAALFACLPVTIDLAHEAKPHLAGAVLILICVWCAMRYLSTGLTRWWFAAGAAAGAAMGMVLTGYVAFAVLPVMALMREETWTRRLTIAVAAGVVGVFIFSLTNPYLPLNVILRRGVVNSNVGNYGTFYQPKVTWTGCQITVQSLIDGASPTPAALGLLSIVLIRTVMRLPRDTGLRPVTESENAKDSIHPKTPVAGRRPVSRWALFFAPAFLLLIQMFLLADGKTAEYARFGLLIDVVLAMLAVALIGALQLKPREKGLLALLVVVGTLFFGARYDRNFILDSREGSTRQLSARVIQACRKNSNTLAVWAEPAPYCLPPVNLFDWKIVLESPNKTSADIASDAIAVRPVDDPSMRPAGMRQFTTRGEQNLLLSPISWANKPFEILGHSQPMVSQPATRP